MPTLYRLLADAVMIAHFAIVLFVIGGLAAIVAGNLRGWRGVNAWPFRLAHLAAMLYIAAQAWLGVDCPLTVLEAFLRARAGDTGYTGAFVAHWVERLLYWQAPAWVFTGAYTAFALLIALAWLRWPPARR
ncbi:MAG: DUF2784 domain-containing protein [Gammaproteobacteria bacterium]